MKKDFSNLRNQKKKVDEPKVEAEETDEEAKAEPTDETAVDEEAKAPEAEAEEDSEDESEKVYFVNSNNTNLHTMVGDFHNSVFVAKTDAEAECIRKTEDFARGFIKEMNESEYKKSIKK